MQVKAESSLLYISNSKDDAGKEIWRKINSGNTNKCLVAWFFTP